MKSMLITGASRGIGRHLAEYYCRLRLGFQIFGCSRGESDFRHANYTHFQLDICNEAEVIEMFRAIPDLFYLINNAGIASMNHSLLTPVTTARKIFETNVLATFLCAQQAAKRMKSGGHIINFSSVAVPLNLEGEAIYAASKAAVVTLTKILAKEFAHLDIKVNAIGPNPIRTDLIRKVPMEKIDKIISQQAIKQMGEFEDITHIIDSLIDERNEAITGQVIYLGGF